MGRLTGLMVIFVIVMAWNYDNRSSMYQSSTSSHLGAMIKGYLRNKPVLSLYLDQKRLSDGYTWKTGSRASRSQHDRGGPEADELWKGTWKYENRWIPNWWQRSKKDVPAQIGEGGSKVILVLYLQKRIITPISQYLTNWSPQQRHLHLNYCDMC